MFCPTCGAKASATAKFCSSCGQAMDSDTGTTLMDHGGGFEGETIAPPASTTRKPSATPTPSRSPRSSPTPSPLTSSDAIGGGRFTPGQILAERYRIVALAGRGGMGEVFRAEDLTLGQIVAMKFLPERLSQDEAALSRFHGEVRNARQVSHPNVCRVFDIGEAEGTLFLTMEYVDGEDLASVVRRIGRLSPDKATEIARQICAGLAAAHERGVIHRDLKPANVMLDGAGKIRITDFGLAGLAASMQGEEARVGTPAYMAPEQLAGKEVTTKSDIYSLGLILYEILTGKRAFEASTLQELVRLRESGTITNPSTLVRDLDPRIERVILRCLEKDPAQRPASALKVAAALPGGDPLAASLAAGETPSPEMVAAAGATEGMRPRLAVTLLAIVIAGLFASLLIAEKTQLVNRVPLDATPDVLAARAQEIIRRLGLPNNPADSAYGFDMSGTYLNYVQQNDKSAARWNALAEERPAAMTFWFRQSPNIFFPQQFFGRGVVGGGQVFRDDPPMDTTAMVLLILDTKGHLLHLEAVPPEKSAPEEKTKTADWPALFVASGLTMSEFHAAEPEWEPLAAIDTRAAWTGTLPGRPDLPIRVEAAAFHGIPVSFRLVYPWSTPTQDAPRSTTRAQTISSILAVTLVLVVFVGGIVLALRNIQSDRADVKGATRLGAFVFVAFTVIWILSAHHVADFAEAFSFLIAVASGLLRAFFAVLLYVALEPFVRRREPQILISWTRLLAGKLRDPLVGRDILIGAVYGVGLLLFSVSDNLVLPLLGKLPPIPGGVSTESLLGVRHAMSQVLLYVLAQTIDSLGIFFVLFVLQRILRSTWLATIAVAVAGTLLSLGGNSGEYPIFSTVALVVLYVSFLLVLKYFGLLPLVVGLVVQNVLLVFPATIHLSRWYAAPSLAGLTAIAVLVACGFRTALAGRRVFSLELLDQ